jgi:ATP-dependent Clp protease adaptor protein ClpS
MGTIKTDAAEDVRTRTRRHVKEPNLYKVLLHNDDYTTMEFVVEILMTVFNKSIEESTRIMLNVHQKGIGVCGIYTYELAETKVDTVERIARANDFPLKCSMERE